MEGCIIIIINGIEMKLWIIVINVLEIYLNMPIGTALFIEGIMRVMV
jgi:hypothetical protein